MASIKEVSAQYDLTQDTLRYYERIGLIPPVHRNASGVRDYQQEDMNWVEFVKCMRGAGLTIESLIEYVSMFQQGDETVESRKLLLIEQRNLLAKRIEEMQVILNRLDSKIESYETKMVVCEHRLLGDQNH